LSIPMSNEKVRVGETGGPCPRELWFRPSSLSRQVFSGRLDASVLEVVRDVIVDDPEGLTQLDAGGWVIGSE